MELKYKVALVVFILSFAAGYSSLMIQPLITYWVNIVVFILGVLLLFLAVSILVNSNKNDKTVKDILVTGLVELISKLTFGY